MNIEQLKQNEIEILINTFRERPYENKSILSVLKQLQSEDRLSDTQEQRVMHLLISFNLFTQVESDRFPDEYVLRYDRVQDEYFIHDKAINQIRSLKNIRVS